MRGICSIRDCEFTNGAKIHEEFEAVEGINICWQCGDKIIKGFKDAMLLKWGLG